MAEARQVAKTVLHGNGLYTDVDICTEEGTFDVGRHILVGQNSSFTR
jgi:hypothetical protein